MFNVMMNGTETRLVLNIYAMPSQHLWHIFKAVTYSVDRRCKGIRKTARLLLLAA